MAGWAPSIVSRDWSASLADHLNRRVAYCLTHPVSASWIGSERGLVAGFEVEVMGRHYCTFRYCQPQEPSEVGHCTGLTSNRIGELVRELSLLNVYPLEVDMAHCSPAALVHDVFTDRYGPALTHGWVLSEVINYVERYLPRGATISFEGKQWDAFERHVRTKLDLLFPHFEILRRLKLALVGSDDLVELLEDLEANAFLRSPRLLEVVLARPWNAAAAWRAITDSHRPLAPLVVCALPHLVPVDVPPGVMLRRIGIGKRLSRRLRFFTPGLMASLLAACGRCVDLDFTQRVIRHLADILPLLTSQEKCETELEHNRIHVGLALCCRLAQLDQLELRGMRGLSVHETFPFATLLHKSEFLPVLNGCPEEWSENMLIAPIRYIRGVMLTFVRYIRDVPNSQYLEDACSRFRDAMDWVVGVGVAIPSDAILQGSFESLLMRTRAWHEEITVHSKPSGAWRCVVQERQEMWRSLERAAADVHPLRIIPLVNSAQLAEESRVMHHCVAKVYLEPALLGTTRLFSLEFDGKKYATLELGYAPWRRPSAGWEIRQFKGVRNANLGYLLQEPGPVQRVMHELVKFYNAVQPLQFSPVRIERK